MPDAGMTASNGCSICHGDTLRESGVDEGRRRGVLAENCRDDRVDIGDVVRDHLFTILRGHPASDDGLGLSTVEAVECLYRHQQPSVGSRNPPELSEVLLRIFAVSVKPDEDRNRCRSNRSMDQIAAGNTRFDRFDLRFCGHGMYSRCLCHELSLKSFPKMRAFGSSRPSEPSRKASRACVLAEVDRFLAQWAAHDTPLRAGRDIRYDRFLFVAVDQQDAGPSGCSIDALVRQMKALQQELGAELVDHAPVLFRRGRGDRPGCARRVCRAGRQWRR